MSRFHVMAILQAARAEFLGMDLEHAYSWGLNRSIFYAAAKRGFAPSHHTTGIGTASKRLSEAQYLQTANLGNERALIDTRTGWFTIGGQDQTPVGFKRQIAGRIRDFDTVWSEAIKLVSSFPDDVLLSQQAFYAKVYQPNRDALAARWG